MYYITSGRIRNQQGDDFRVYHIFPSFFAAQAAVETIRDYWWEPLDKDANYFPKVKVGLDWDIAEDPFSSLEEAKEWVAQRIYHPGEDLSYVEFDEYSII